MSPTVDFPRVEVTSPAQLRDWLMEHHGQSQSVWLVTYKKHVTGKYVSVAEVLDELLCFGWVDGVRRKLDGERTMQLISPRRVQHWAQSYKDRAARLMEEGRMQPPGLRAMEESKRLGLWDEMADVDALQIPDDLTAALRAHPPALETFEAFAPSYRRNVLRWIKLAKTDATRTKRLLRTAEASARGEKLPQI